MSNTPNTNLADVITEDHPVYKAALSAYDGVKTCQVRNSILKVVKATLNAYDEHKIAANG